MMPSLVFQNCKDAGFAWAALGIYTEFYLVPGDDELIFRFVRSMHYLQTKNAPACSASFVSVISTRCDSLVAQQSRGLLIY